jgi:hypothetical protein
MFAVMASSSARFCAEKPGISGRVIQSRKITSWPSGQRIRRNTVFIARFFQFYIVVLPATRRGQEQTIRGWDAGSHFEYFAHKSKLSER